MERSQLEAWVAQGLTLDRMAWRAGRPPSTIRYWLREHGLRTARAERHGLRGSLSRERLQELVERGLSQREIAAEVERSQSTVRYWLGRFALDTVAEKARIKDGAGERVARCPTHGLVDYVVQVDGTLRCKRCRAEAVSRWRRRVKRTLIEEAGGGCVACGYDVCAAALQFHHVDPEQKSFAIGGRGLARSIDKLRAEAAKCVLLCSNCHAEVGSGFRRLDLQSSGGSLGSEAIHHNPG